MSDVFESHCIGAERKSWIPGLPQTLRNKALLCASQHGVPLEISALVILGAVAASLGKGLAVRSGGNRQTRGNLYLLLGVPSGVGKSEVFRDLFNPHLNFEKGLSNWWEEEAAPRARAGDELLKGVISGLRSAGRRTGRPNLDLFRRLQATKRQRTICSSFLEPPGIVAHDITAEALMALMQRSGEAIAVVSPDARNILMRLAARNSKMESMFLKGFSGDLASTHRISRRTVRLGSPCLTTVLLTQRDAYQRFVHKLGVTGTGLLPRFLRSEFQGAENGSSHSLCLHRAKEIEREYAQLIQNLLETFRFADEGRLITPSNEAMEFLNACEKKYRQEAAQDESIQGEILRRRAEQAWRVALVLHAGRLGHLSAAKQLGLPDAQTAIRLLEWLQAKG